MNVTRCTNGHYYDMEKYQLCPHCGAKSVDDKGQKAGSEKGSNVALVPEGTIGRTFGIFDGPNSGRTPKAEPAAPVNSAKPVAQATPIAPIASAIPVAAAAPVATGTPANSAVQEKNIVFPEPAPVKKRFCMYCGKAISDPTAKACPDCLKKKAQQAAPQKMAEPAASGEPVKPAMPQKPAQSAAPQEPAQPAAPQKPAQPDTPKEPAQSAAPQEPAQLAAPAQKTETSSLSEEIKNISAFDNDKTVGFFSAGSSSVSTPVSEPVVGWLVCIKGSHFGESFSLSAGRNSIGRSGNNKIVLSRENTVSREKHAWITYEPKKRQFFLQPGEGSGLVYLNDENLMEPRQLSAKDLIELGESKYILVALCGDNFTWEDYIK